jgi:hypothetical protein
MSNEESYGTCRRRPFRLNDSMEYGGGQQKNKAGSILHGEAIGCEKYRKKEEAEKYWERMRRGLKENAEKDVWLFWTRAAF